MTRKRALALALLLLALAPGTFVRTPVPDRHAQALSIAPVGDLPEASTLAGFAREGLWELTSPNIDFGGYSALLSLPEEGALVAYSDRGLRMRFAAPGTPRAGAVAFSAVDDRGPLSGAFPDIEAAMRDPATGTYWLALENANAMLRYSRGDAFEAARRPPEWRDWPSNAGPEAMERLADGRFIVLREGGTRGLLFAGDPTGETRARTFAVDVPGRYSATDLAQLPDGRLLVLLRHVALAYPPFTAAVGIADPADLERETALEVRLLLDLDRLVPPENWEGMAIDPRPDGKVTVWLVSDDNVASFQRTLLARLAFDPAG